MRGFQESEEIYANRVDTFIHFDDGNSCLDVSMVKPLIVLSHGATRRRFTPGDSEVDLESCAQMHFV